MSVSRRLLLVLGAVAVALAGGLWANRAVADRGDDGSAGPLPLRAPLDGTARRAAFAANTGGDMPASEPGQALGDKPDAGEEAPKTRYLVAAMGDSLTDPRSKGGRYLEYLRARCPESRFDSYGIGGNMVNQMRRRFLRDIYGTSSPRDAKQKPATPKPRYTHVLVLGGINDICSDQSAHRTNPKIKKDLAWMYATARARGAKVIALTLPPWGGFKRYYNRRRANSTFEINAWIRQRHKAGDVDALLDVYPIMSCGNDELLCERYGWPDKVHWNKAGHQVVGKALHATIFADCK